MKKICAFFLCLAAAFAAGCSAPVYRTEYIGTYLGAPVSVVLDTHALSKARYNTLIQGVKDIFGEIDDLTDPQDISSDIYAFNVLKAGESVTVSPLTADILSAALRIGEISSGAFSVTAYPLVDLWGFSPEKYNDENFDFVPPAEEEIQRVLPLCDLGNVSLENNVLTKLNFDGVKIDLGGIAKGYAVQKAAEYLRENGADYGYISAGTSSIALMKYKEDAEWNFSVRHPRKASTLISFPESDTYVSTSGDYERYREYGGKKYTHIIDIKTGRPIENGMMTAVVLGNNSACCDALSTALSVLGPDGAKEFTEKYLSDYKVFFAYTENGLNYLYANVPREDFTVDDGSFIFVS